MRLFLAAGFSALAVAGCGSTKHHTNGHASKPAKCIITPSGNKLCGHDANAWCAQNLTGNSALSLDRECLAILQETTQAR